MDFEGKVVVVTGASAGIGEVIAEEFARRGAQLVLVGRNGQNLRAVADRCTAILGKDVLPIIADLATDAGCEKTAKETVEHFGRVDVLVNNAGVGCRTAFESADMAIFDTVFNTDVRGVYYLTALLVPALVKAKGNIINISSIVGTRPTVGSVPYGMAKAALDHFTQIIALELAPKGVRVNTVSPGLTVSTFHKRMIPYTEEEYLEWLRGFEQKIPLGRVCVGADIARMVVHLASDASALVTGTIVPIDGGLRFVAGPASQQLAMLQQQQQ